MRAVKVTETALVDPAEDFNPFAAPSVAPETVALVNEGIGRATATEIQTAIKSLVASEISMLLLCCMWWISTIWATEITLIAWAAPLGIAWFCFACMVFSSSDLDITSVAAVVSFPIPLLGILVFFGAKKQSSRFLVWNGYTPKFLGAQPDPVEVRLMNANSNYRPSVLFYPDGSRKRPTPTLTNSKTCFTILLLVAIVLAFLASS